MRDVDEDVLNRVHAIDPLDRSYFSVLEDIQIEGANL